MLRLLLAPRRVGRRLPGTGRRREAAPEHRPDDRRRPRPRGRLLRRQGRQDAAHRRAREEGRPLHPRLRRRLVVQPEPGDPLHRPAHPHLGAVRPRPRRPQLPHPARRQEPARLPAAGGLPHRHHRQDAHRPRQRLRLRRRDPLHRPRRGRDGRQGREVHRRLRRQAVLPRHGLHRPAPRRQGLRQRHEVSRHRRRDVRPEDAAGPAPPARHARGAGRPRGLLPVRQPPRPGRRAPDGAARRRRAATRTRSSSS